MHQPKCIRPAEFDVRQEDIGLWGDMALQTGAAGIWNTHCAAGDHLQPSDFIVQKFPTKAEYLQCLRRNVVAVERVFEYLFRDYELLHPGGACHLSSGQQEAIERANNIPPLASRTFNGNREAYEISLQQAIANVALNELQKLHLEHGLQFFRKLMHGLGGDFAVCIAPFILRGHRSRVLAGFAHVELAAAKSKLSNMKVLLHFCLEFLLTARAPE